MPGAIRGSSASSQAPLRSEMDSESGCSDRPLVPHQSKPTRTKGGDSDHRPHTPHFQIRVNPSNPYHPCSISIPTPDSLDYLSNNRRVIRGFLALALLAIYFHAGGPPGQRLAY